MKVWMPIWRTLQIFMLGLGTFLTFDVALALVNASSDVSFAASVLIICLLFLYWIKIGARVFINAILKLVKGENMKKLAMLLAVASMMYVTGCTRIGPGHVGVVVDMAGSDKGVLDAPAQTGWVFYNPMGTSVIEYPTFVQTVVWTASKDEGNPQDESITFTNKDQMSINADISLSYSLVGTKVPAFYVKFKTDDLETFTNGFMRNVARDCMNEHGGKYEIAQLMGDNGVFLAEVRACIQATLSPYGVNIEQFGIIGAPRPPKSVIDSINNKNQAQQIALQKQMELQQVEADAAKQVAAAEGHAKSAIAEANGEAEANRIRSASITTTILENKKLDNQHDMIWRWNGETPKTVLGGGQGSSLLLQLPKDN